jgi:ABC-2 type transport system permease protein
MTPHGLTRAAHAEWTKLRTERNSLGLVLAIVVGTVGLSLGVMAALRAGPCPAEGCVQDVPKLSLTGITLGQAVVVVLAVLVMSGEYGTGMIRSTLAAVPDRSAVLVAKALVLSGVILAAGAVVVLGSLLAGRLILPGHGYSQAHGYAPLSLADAGTLRAAAGSVLYLVLIALLSLGVATVVRDAGAASGIILGLLYLVPVLSQVIQDPHWRRQLQQVAPMPAGLAVQATVNLADLPISPWRGLAVLAGWAAAALIIGWLRLRFRDA